MLIDIAGIVLNHLCYAKWDLFVIFHHFGVCTLRQLATDMTQAVYHQLKL